MLFLVVSLLLALPPTISVDEILPEATGECLTVFSGDRVEPFAFTVRGVMRDFLGPGQDLILVRLGGEKAEFVGVASGMSGSPCFIGGRLMGALSYAFATFAKEPIAGITPIARMLEVMTMPEQARPWRLAKEEQSAAWSALRAGEAPGGAASADDGLKPIAASLSLTGFLPEVARHFSPWLASHGFEPVAAGSAGAAVAPRKLEPGSAVAALLLKGDVNAAATGTVTVVDGEMVLAFGHPFLGAGPVSFPMANAEIVNTMVSSMRSFKMATPGAVIGEVTQDRLPAIGGYLGRVAAMIPVKGRFGSAGKSSAFAFEVARDVALSPRLLAMGLANSLAGRLEAGARGTLRIEARLHVAGQPPVIIRNVYAAESDSGLFLAPALDVGEAFELLWDTPFGPPPAMSVELVAEHDPEPIIEWIEAVRVASVQARPEEELEIEVRLRDTRSKVSTERFLVPVPHAWAGASVEITAASAVEAEKLERRLSGAVEPRDFAEIAKWLARRRPDGQVYLAVTRAGAGVRAGTEVLPFLPPSFVATMSGVPAVAQRTRGLAFEARRRRPGVVSGSASATVNIVKP